MIGDHINDKLFSWAMCRLLRLDCVIKTEDNSLRVICRTPSLLSEMDILDRRAGDLGSSNLASLYSNSYRTRGTGSPSAFFNITRRSIFSPFISFPWYVQK